MSNLGLGVMIRALSGGSDHEPSEYIGQMITCAELRDGGDGSVRLTLSGGKVIEIAESRAKMEDAFWRDISGDLARDHDQAVVAHIDATGNVIPDAYLDHGLRLRVDDKPAPAADEPRRFPAVRGIAAGPMRVGLQDRSGS